MFSSSLTSSNLNIQKCFIPHRIRLEWLISFGLAIGAFALLTLTILLLVISKYSRRPMVEYSRITGFIASMRLLICSVEQMNN